jgi:uncharacterized protein (TIGR02118 family)
LALIKIFEFLVRKPGLTREQFNYHWLNVHGPLVIGIPEISRHLVRYCQNHLIPDWPPVLPGREPPCDGVVELWCESVDAVREMFGAPANLDAVRDDEHLFLDVGKGRLLITEDATLHERAGTGETHGSIKFFAMIARKAGLSRAAFDHHWRETHAPLIVESREIAGRLRKYSQCAAIDDFDGNIPSASYDGLAEYWFDGTDDLWAALTSPAYRETVRPDEAAFQDEAHTNAAVAREILMYERD